MKPFLQKLLNRENLSSKETTDAFDLIMAGTATPAQMGAFLTALRMKGETVEEIAAAAGSMRRHAVLIHTGGRRVVDTCGTGGDQSNTFNISTASAFVVAGAGVPVAKHGNRAVSSGCGSADVLAALGVNIEAPPEVVEECIQTVGIGFLFAPRMHPAMKHVAGVRKELGVRTIFNMLGPLTNPAGASGQILGVFSAELTEPFAHVLRSLGSQHALVVHGNDGLDEITVTTTTRVSELKGGAVRTYELDPLPWIGEFHAPETLKGGDPAANAEIIRRILSGEPGPRRDIVLLNAAGGILAGDKAADFPAAIELARQSIDSGKAMDCLKRLIEETR